MDNCETEKKLVLVEQEPKKDKLKDLQVDYNILNIKCDEILAKIHARKAKKSA